MSEADSYRGGNSRLLAKQLDLLDWPIVVLGQRSTIVFASRSLCQLVHADATRLVGIACNSEISPDLAPFRELAMALAPPSEVLHGQAIIRHIPWPPKDPTATVAQAFLPLIDQDPSSGLILVLFGERDVLSWRLAPLAPERPSRGAAADEVLLRMRSQYQNLDGLWPLVGESPAIQLAMRRAQLASETTSGVMIWGPAGSGKSEIARALFAIRTRGIDVPANAVHSLPLDCGMVDESMAASLLDSLEARLRPGLPPIANHLLLERVDLARDATIQVIDAWLTAHGSSVCTISTTEFPPSQLGTRSPAMSRLVNSINTIEIHLPAVATRRQDVAPLIQHALAAVAGRTGRRLPAIAPRTQELLEAYPWPGNAVEVRQTAADMLGSAVLTSTILTSHLPLPIRTFSSTLNSSRNAGVESISLDEVLLDLERIMLERAIKLSPRNRARAARLLGISRPRFLRRISQLGLDKAAKTGEEE